MKYNLKNIEYFESGFAFFGSYASDRNSDVQTTFNILPLEPRGQNTLGFSVSSPAVSFVDKYLSSIIPAKTCTRLNYPAVVSASLHPISIGIEHAHKPAMYIVDDSKDLTQQSDKSKDPIYPLSALARILERVNEKSALKRALVELRLFSDEAGLRVCRENNRYGYVLSMFLAIQR
jgi:hypothetical protein